MNHYLILGCGFTGVRVARALLERGEKVVCTTRDPERLAGLAESGATVIALEAARPETFGALRDALTPEMRVLDSVPLLHGPTGLADPTPSLLAALGTFPSRLVYLSTTGVYGNQSRVDETTEPAPVLPRQSLRVDAERAVAAGPWQSLILRPAGIYGPGRGVHVSMRLGRHRIVGDGSNYLSRIHVDDLATITAAALLSDLTGAYPVADDYPSPALEIAEFCSNLLGIPRSPFVPPEEASETLRFDRRIDGTAIRRELGVTLRYPSFREGIPACLAEEQSRSR